jgi:excinuclease UvrABC nuclease subunit
MVENTSTFKQTITFEPIILEWTRWYIFSVVVGNRVLVPKLSGVYEVIEPNNECRLTIGESKNLNRRIRHNLIKGSSHSAGEDIKKHFAPIVHSTLLVRWALTSKRAAVQEELHRLHMQVYDCMPRYTDKT